MVKSQQQKKQQKQQKISAQVETAVADFNRDNVTVQSLLDKLGRRTLGLTLLVCALPNLIPFANVVGITWVLAPVLMLLSLQLTLQLQQPWLPQKLLKTKVDSRKIKKMANKTLPYLQKFERIFARRLTWLFPAPMLVLVGIICFLLAAVMLVPLLPLGDSLPALLISLFAISLMQRDGLLLLITLSSTIITISALYGLWFKALNAFFGGA